MNTLQVNILNPKVEVLLQTLAEMKLISIKKGKGDEFLKAVKKIRAMAKSNPPSLEEITREVDAVRTERYTSHG